MLLCITSTNIIRISISAWHLLVEEDLPVDLDLQNIKSTDKCENVCAATCPVVLLTDNLEHRVYIPELIGSCSATFLPIINKGAFNKSKLPILPQGNARVQAFDDILHAAFTELFVQKMYRGESGADIIADGAQDAIRKYANNCYLRVSASSTQCV